MQRLLPRVQKAHWDFLSVHLIYLNLCSQTLETVVLINFGIVRGNILLLKYLTLALLRYGISSVQ